MSKAMKFKFKIQNQLFYLLNLWTRLLFVMKLLVSQLSSEPLKMKDFMYKNGHNSKTDCLRAKALLGLFSQKKKYFKLT